MCTKKFLLAKLADLRIYLKELLKVDFVIYRVRHLSFFFSSSAYFLNGNTQLMSDLTDNQFHPSVERIWLCIRFAKWALQNMPILAKKIIFSDEAYSDLDGQLNKQNCRIWGTENPHAYIEKLMHPNSYLPVWCGFWSRGIIGPFFFENEQEEAVTVNGDRYRAMFNEFLFTKI